MDLLYQPLFILVNVLFFSTGITVFFSSHQTPALEIVEKENDRAFSHDPQFLLSRAFDLALTLEGDSEEEKSDRLELLGEIARAAIDSGQWDTKLFEGIIVAIEAIEFVESYRQQYQEGELGNIADKLQEVGAIARAIEITKKLRNARQKTYRLWDIAKFWIERKDRNRGREFLLQAAESAKKIEDVVINPTACEDMRSDLLQWIAIDFVRLEEIEIAFDLVRAIRSCGGLYDNTSNIASSRALLAILDFVNDTRNWQEALSIVETFTDIPDKRHALENMIPRMLDPKDLQRALKIARTLKAYEVLGGIVENRSPLELAIVKRWLELSQIEDAIALGEQITHLPARASAFLKIGRYFAETGNDRAEFWLNRTLDLASDLDNSGDRADILAEIAFARFKAGQTEEAMEFLQPESELSLDNIIELRKILELLIEDNRVDLSIQLIENSRNSERKIRALILVSRKLVEQENTQQAGELLRQAVSEIIDHLQELDSEGIWSFIHNILEVEIRSIAQNRDLKETGAKRNALSIEHYELLHSILLTLETSSKWATIGNIATHLDFLGETNRAFEVLESMRSGNDYNTASEMVRGFTYFFKRLENNRDRQISREQKRSYFIRTLAIIESLEDSNDRGDLAVAIAPLASELEQFEGLFPILGTLKRNSLKKEATIALIQNLEDRSGLVSIFQTMTTFFDSYTNANILVETIPHLKTEEEIELALEFSPTLTNSGQLKILSASAIRFAELGNVDRAVKLADAIADVRLKALTFAKIAVTRRNPALTVDPNN